MAGGSGAAHQAYKQDRISARPAEEAIEELRVLMKIERGIIQADQGETLTRQDMEDRITCLMARSRCAGYLAIDPTL